MAERMNKLHIHPDGSTPESKLYGIDPDEIPVGTYHTLFCPVYVLDSKLQSARGIGPLKWDPRSCIGVYEYEYESNLFTIYSRRVTIGADITLVFLFHD